MFFYNIRFLTGINSEDSPYLRGKNMAKYGILENAWLRTHGDKIIAYGTADTEAENMRSAKKANEQLIDVKGGMIMPSFCDSHTHIIYSGCRDGEFVDKINGLSYEEIARRGGGILNSVDLLRNTPEDELYTQALHRAEELIRKGTGALEIKSGYGLSVRDELKMLRVAARIKETTPLTTAITFLGAHAVAREFKGDIDAYVTHLINEMLPAVNAQGLAGYVDVFCDEGFFTPEHTDRILTSAAKYGLRPKIHANELAVSGGVEIGVAHRALSVDHLERAEQAQIELLAKSETAATMLPGASFFLSMPYGKARMAIDKGCIVNLASDYNPGSSPSRDMRMVGARGCIKMKLLPAESLCATTLNGAYAMGVSKITGSITPGKKANLIMTAPVHSPAFIYYAYTTPYIEKVFLNGSEIK